MEESWSFERVFNTSYLYIGKSRVGKSSLISRFNSSCLPLEEVSTDIHFSFSYTKHDEGFTLITHLWEIPGSAKNYAKGILMQINAIIAVFDANDKESFEELRKIIKETDKVLLNSRCNKKKKLWIVGNKIDIAGEVVGSSEKLEEYISVIRDDIRGLTCIDIEKGFFVSAMTGENVGGLYQNIAEVISKDEEEIEKKIFLHNRSKLSTNSNCF